MIRGIVDKYIAFLDVAERRRLRWVLALILAGALGESAGLALVLPYIGFLQQVSVENASLFSFALFVSAAFLLVILGRVGMQLWVSRTITEFTYQAGENHSKRLFQRYLMVDYQHFTSKNSSVLVKNCTHSMDEAAYGLLLFLQLISSLCIALGLTIVLLIDNTFATLILASAFTCLSVPIYQYFKQKQRQAGMQRDATLGEIHKLTTEAFQCFKEVHLYGKWGYFEQRFAQHAKRLKRANVDSTFYPSLPTPCIEAVAMCALIGLVLWFLWIDVPLQQLVPQLIFYGVIGRRLLPSLHQTIYFGMALQKLQPCMELVHREYEQTLLSATQSAASAPFEHKIEIKDLSFAYEPPQLALAGVSFSLLRNQSVALVGPSGSGKSTIVEILTSLLRATQGHFFVDDQRAPDLTALRHQIGYVPQMVNLIDDTLQSNIAFGEELVDPVRLQNALKMAHLDEWLAQLPQGLQTVIGERGVKLSGGQRQRLGIARALYFDPQIIIFDEATASLDAISERIIAENILEIAGHKTILAIAHRISTIKNFDRIYVLNEGRIIDSGKHQELIARCGLYREMHDRSSNQDILL